MLKVRLQRVGRRNDPSFRVVVTDSLNSTKSRNYLESVGSYNPRQKTVTLEGDKIKEWIAKGAKPSDTVHNLLIKEGVIKGEKVNPLPKKSPVVKAAKPEAVDDSKDESATADSEETKETPTTEEAPKEEPKEETKVEEPKEEKPAESPEEPKEEKKEEAE